MSNKKKYIKCCVCKEKYKFVENEELPKNCPFCKENYWEKPINEKKLMNLQDKYFEDTSNKKPFHEMILIVEGILHNIIAKKLKSSAVYLEDEKRHDLVMESLIDFLDKYKNDPNFKITGSFIGYLNTVVLKPLYNPKKKWREQNVTSLNTPIKGKDNLYLYHLLEIVDGDMGSEKFILNRLQENIQVDAILLFIDRLFIHCVKSYDLKIGLIVLRSIQLQFNPQIKEKDITEFWENYSNKDHLLSEHLMSLVYNFVKEEIIVKNECINYEEYIKNFGEIEDYS